ncbi:hypothetical protein SEA_RICKMORE_26 [Gordonia phage Rickmore]|uniref:Minor tail protein n=1 Tax=Gordonia phage Rickmore TaxID=2507854 RepID=A0A410TB62_9CAUD|nr:hypothetical protein HWC05_gp26 [Gordonia phage Rickmore]QAU06261.1 hypothetical protein SEA_RICKMORE_26 [Gordonia phage Rickmore]
MARTDYNVGDSVSADEMNDLGLEIQSKLSKEDADLSFALLWESSTNYEQGAKVISPLTGDVIRRLASGTSRETFDVVEQGLTDTTPTILKAGSYLELTPIG